MPRLALALLTRSISLRFSALLRHELEGQLVDLAALANPSTSTAVQEDQTSGTNYWLERRLRTKRALHVGQSLIAGALVAGVVGFARPRHSRCDCLHLL